MARFHTLSIKEVRQETEDTVSVAFEVPEAQHEAFQFEAGQYLTLRAEIAGEDVRRSYSICTSPAENDLRVAIKAVEEGRFSTFANRDLKAGDTLEVMPPMGNFKSVIDPQQRKRYALFAAGSGITPVIAILKTVLDSEPESEVLLFYGNRTFDSIIFREELAGLKNRYMDRLQVVHVLSRESVGSALNKGRIDQEKCDLWAKTIFKVSSYDEFFICGPEQMINAVSEWLKSQHVAPEKVHFELFTSPAGPAAQVTKKGTKPKAAQGPTSQVEVVLDGDSLEFDLARDGESILDAAARAGGDLPYACKGGVCCTCRAKVIEGKASMDVNYALEPYEVEAGFVLTCQAHPESEKVVVSFDEV